MALFFRRRRERTLYLPWERRGPLALLQLPRRRARFWLLVLLAVGVLLLLHRSNQRGRAERMTRAALQRTRDALDAYRADHAGRCPRDLAELTAPGDRPAYLARPPLDAWKRPLRFECPARDPLRPYDLASDGPDGEAHGIDRIE